jgi:hypothetical protein
MQPWKQYGALAGLLAAGLAAGFRGFTATGGPLPWARRSAQALQRGVRENGGALVDFGRGVVVAGPIRKGGLVAEFLGVVVLLSVVGVGLYVYADRYRGLGETESTTR